MPAYSYLRPTGASKAIVCKKSNKGRPRGRNPDIARSSDEYLPGDFDHRQFETGVGQKRLRIPSARVDHDNLEGQSLIDERPDRINETCWRSATNHDNRQVRSGRHQALCNWILGAENLRREEILTL